jgi:hypothetical protein
MIIILFGNSYTLGGNILITKDFSAPQLPLGILLLAIIFVIENKFIIASFFLILTSYLHLHIGLEGGMIVFTSFILGILLHKKSFDLYFKNLLLSIFVFLLGIFPLVLLNFSEIIQDDNQKANTIIDILVHARTPHHYLASSWPFAQYINFLFLIILYLYLFKIKKNKGLPHFFVRNLVIIPLVLFFIGYFFTEIKPFYTLIIAQVYRMTMISYWVVSVYIYSFILTRKNKNLISKILLLLPFIYSNYQNFHIGKSSLLSYVILSFLVIFYKKLPALLIIVLLLIGFYLQHYHNNFNFSSYINHPTDESNLAIWSKENTESNSVFLIPLDFEKFRLISNRAVVVDWKAFPFQKKSILEWGERICDVSNLNHCNFKNIDLNTVISGYRSHNINSIRKLSEKYSFDYFITRHPMINLHPLYSHGFYIYKWPPK